ncbi:MAG TPA: T9SS type A sorting domain-containing protein, partial [Prolixibacteraceae bacterium]|nr:T9SS type A sorting domain-containing protein [Prolixibacteraceae bacterium]
SGTGLEPQTITVTQSLNTSLSVPEKDGIIVYPNPFIQGFHVSGIRGKTTLRLADRTGRVLMVRETGGDEYWDAGDLPAGLYMVKIITPLASREIKLVKK